MKREGRRRTGTGCRRGDRSDERRRSDPRQRLEIRLRRPAMATLSGDRVDCGAGTAGCRRATMPVVHAARTHRLPAVMIDRIVAVPGAGSTVTRMVLMRVGLMRPQMRGIEAAGVGIGAGMAVPVAVIVGRTGGVIVQVPAGGLAGRCARRPESTAPDHQQHRRDAAGDHASAIPQARK